MDTLFEKLKKEVEEELGRPLDQTEEIELKALYFFGKGVKLKSEIETCMERRSLIIDAVGAFLSGKPKRLERRKIRKQKAEQGKLL